MADLQTLINAIPVAEDGHIISRDYHNSLRDALVELASSLQTAPPGQTSVATWAPNFLPITGRNPWLLTEGVGVMPPAPDPSSTSACDGWFAITLPQGAQIQKVRVIGGRSGAVPSFNVQLLRQPLTDPGLTTLCVVPLNTAGLEQDPFQGEAPIRVAGLTPAEQQQLTVVDNSQFKYLIKGHVVGAPAATTIRIYAVAVEFAHPS